MSCITCYEQHQMLSKSLTRQASDWILLKKQIAQFDEEYRWSQVYIIYLLYYYSSTEISTTCLSEHLKWRLIRQYVGNYVTSYCTTSFVHIRRLNLLCIARCTCNIWRNEVFFICLGIKCHIKCSVDILITLSSLYQLTDKKTLTQTL